jgi:cation diffusion facilitator family transporter
MGGGHSHGTGAYDDRDAVRAVVVSAVALGVASAVEFAAAVGGHSAGVLADALHNAGDVLTTGILLASFWLGRRPATRRFPSGFGQIEDVATLLIVLVIVVTAGVAAWESILKLLNPVAVGNVPFGLFAAGVGVAANLAVSGYKVRVGRSIRSSALQADGVHSRIDALVSAGAAVGIGLAAAGFGWADPIAGLAITAMILYILAGTVRDLFYRMMDAVDPEVLAEIAEHAGSVPGVLGVHDISARWVGRQMAVVLHVDCDPRLGLREAHELAIEVEREVGHAVPAGRIDVHMDPGTDHHHHDASVSHRDDAESGH